MVLQDSGKGEQPISDNTYTRPSTMRFPETLYQADLLFKIVNRLSHEFTVCNFLTESGQSRFHYIL